MTTKMIRRSAIAIATLLLVVSCKSEITIPVDPPAARKDYARTAVDTPVVVTPLANDHDPNAEALTVVEIGTAAHGTAVLNLDQTVTYTPDLGYEGGDSFTVTIEDASGNQATELAYVSIGDSTRIIYRSNFEDYFTQQVYITDFNFPGVAIPVSQYVRITEGPFPSESNVEVYTLSPDGTHVVLVADDSDESNARNVFVVDLAQPGVATPVTDLQVGQGVNVVNAPRLTADNAYVLYLSNEFQPLINELVMVEVANPANKVRVNPALVTGQALLRFELTPDGERVVFVVANSTTFTNDIYVAELATPGAWTRINGTVTASTGGVLEFTATGGIGFKFVPGTDQLVYPSTEAGATLAELWLVDHQAPAAPVKVSGTPVTLGVVSFQFTNDGTRVIYNAYQDSAAQLELYMGSLTSPGTIAQLNLERTGEFNLTTWAVGQDSTFVVYLTDELTLNEFELFKVDLATPGVSTRMTPALPDGTDVITLALSTASPRALTYTARLNRDRPFEQTIFSMDVDVPEVSAQVGEVVEQLGTLLPIYTPTGDALIYQGDPGARSVNAIYSFTVADPTTVTKLTPERFPGDGANALLFLP